MTKSALPETNKRIKLEQLKDYKGHCLTIAMDDDINKGVIACPVSKDSDKVIFYLYQKSENNYFSEIKSWTFSEPNELKVQKINDGQSLTILINRIQNWNLLNGHVLKDVCTVEWNFGDASIKRAMTCKVKKEPWFLERWEVNLLNL